MPARRAMSSAISRLAGSTIRALRGAPAVIRIALPALCRDGTHRFLVCKRDAATKSCGIDAPAVDIGRLRPAAFQFWQAPVKQNLRTRGARLRRPMGLFLICLFLGIAL